VCVSDESWTWHNRKLTLIHELGHAIGLDHSPDKRSVMYDTLTGAEPTLTVYEHELLKSIYSG
jgi:predicted Zn-dependent protease